MVKRINVFLSIHCHEEDKKEEKSKEEKKKKGRKTKWRMTEKAKGPSKDFAPLFFFLFKVSRYFLCSFFSA